MAGLFMRPAIFNISYKVWGIPVIPPKKTAL